MWVTLITIHPKVLGSGHFNHCNGLSLSGFGTDVLTAILVLFIRAQFWTAQKPAKLFARQLSPISLDDFFPEAFTLPEMNIAPARKPSLKETNLSNDPFAVDSSISGGAENPEVLLWVTSATTPRCVAEFCALWVVWCWYDVHPWKVKTNSKSTWKWMVGVLISFWGIACYVPLPNYSPNVKNPVLLGGAKVPEMVYFPTKWGAKEHQNPQNH